MRGLGFLKVARGIPIYKMLIARGVSDVPPVQSLRDSAAATPVGDSAWRRRFRNDDGGSVVAVWTEGVCGGEGLTTGVVRHACRHRVTARGVFVLGDSFAVGLGAVAGACVDHRSGQTRMPPQERRHEEVFVLGDSFAVGLGVVAEACVGRGSGQPRMPPRERQHEEVFVLGDSFAVGLGAVAGAWVDHRSGQTRMPPQERRHERVRVEGLIRCAGRALERPFGAVTPLERRDED